MRVLFSVMRQDFKVVLVCVFMEAFLESWTISAIFICRTNTICLFVFQSVFSVHFPICCLAVLFPCYLISIIVCKFYMWDAIPSVAGIDSLPLCRCLCALLIVSADFFFMVSHLLILRSVPMLLLFFLINMSLLVLMSSQVFPMFS